MFITYGMQHQGILDIRLAPAPLCTYFSIKCNRLIVALKNVVLFICRYLEFLCKIISSVELKKEMEKFFGLRFRLLT